MYSVRVSKVAVLDTLKKYLADELANDIFEEIVKIDENDYRSMIGMTIKEWNERFDEKHEVVWADDTCAGFGRAGDPVCGNMDDCVICMTMQDMNRLCLCVWCEGLYTDNKMVLAAMDVYHKRHSVEGCHESL